MADQLVEFLERAFVEQQVDALAGGEFAFVMLAGFAFLSAPGFGVGVAAAEFVNAIGHKRLGYR